MLDNTPASMVHAMQQQLAVWDHLDGPQHAADRNLMLIMAEGIDAARESVATGSAALPLVNACRYVFDALRKMAPADAEPTDGFDDAMWEE